VILTLAQCCHLRFKTAEAKELKVKRYIGNNQGTPVSDHKSDAEKSSEHAR